ncbi:MAG: hypothetical protein Q9217_000616 [Psora testacea]
MTMSPPITQECVAAGEKVQDSNSKGRDVTMHGASTHPKTLSQLPPETLQSIVGYVDWNDLLNIQTLSRQFHGLASTEIYRNLDFNITSSEGDDKGDIASRAADALQTINISNYDYAQHIRSFRLGLTDDSRLSTPGLIYSVPSLVASVVFDSRSDSSKFLNTSVLLMVRRASILESFKWVIEFSISYISLTEGIRWDLPLEMSGAVYQALQKIPSLRYLRIRMDVHPAPKLIPSRSPYNPSHPPPPPNFSQPPPPHNPSSIIVPSLSQSHTPAYKGQSSKRKKSGGSTFWTNRRAFSGFTTLNTLEIVRLANLDCLGEISQCIRASAASLKSLTVTLDPELVMKAQRSTSTSSPQNLDDLSDTELEDEMFLDPASSIAHASQPLNEADIRQEKSAQEGILARLFDLESLAPKGKKLERKLGLVGGKCLKEERYAALGSKMNRLLQAITDENGLSSSNVDTAKLEKIKILREMADLYISEHGVRPRKASKSQKEKPPPAKKPQKPSKSKGPNYPPPIAASSKLDPKWEDFLEEDYGPAVASPISADFGVGSLSSKPAGFPQYQINNSSSSLHLPPPLPHAGGTTSSLEPLVLPYSGATSSALDLAPPLPYYNSTKKSGASGQSSYFDSDLTPYFSPYTSNSHKSLHKDHTKSLTSSGTQTPSIIDKYETFSGAHTHKEPPLSSGTLSLNKHTKNTKHHPWGPKTAKFSTVMSSPSSDNDSDSQSKAESPSKAPFFAAEAANGPSDAIDIDMDHPDEDQSDLGENQESASGSDDTEVQTPRKRLKPLEESRASQVKANSGPAPFQGEKHSRRIHIDEMHEYIRTTHGFQLEEFRLHYVPMKASIIGKALDLTILQRITLLETGPQDAFWTLLVKLTSSDISFSFKSIHTDNVSFAVLKYLATFEGLEELFMHERKAKTNDIDSEGGIDIESIREEALRSHCKTLKRLMLRNEKNDSWDVDFKTLHMLAVHAYNLEELAINMKSPTYHGLLQIFPAFKTLRALHLITLRGSDRTSVSTRLESLAYTIDSLAHCPDLNIRYIAIQDIVTEITGHKQFRKHLKRMMESRKPDGKVKEPDKKGKGKALDPLLRDMVNDEGLEMDEKIEGVQTAQRKMRSARRFEEVRHIKIFSIELRSGKL